MRLWMDAEGRLLTDEQMVRFVAHFGSLEAAASRGDIRLVSSSGRSDQSRSPEGRPASRRLADYLSEE